MPRSVFLAFLALVFVADGGAAAPSTAPNILLILADGMGVGDISCLNPKSAWQTPHLDGLAREGMIFSDAHSASAACTPARYTLLTGRYSWRTRLKRGVLNGYSPSLIEAYRTTLPMFLREHGYTTAMFGKWHLGFDWPKRGPKPEDVDFTEPLRGGPTDHGFNRYFGISASLDMPPYVWIENDHVTAPPAGNVGKPIGADFKTEEVQPTLIEKTKAFLAERAAARDRKPFFIYLALAAPRTPVVPTKGFAGKTPTPHGDPWRQIDADVGVLLAALKQHGVAENTLVVFTSDNGFTPAAEDAFEGGHHIPFIVRWPGVTPAGSRCTEVIGQVDFFATCAEFLGVEMNDKMAEDSASILSFLRGQPPSEARPALVHHSGEGEFAIRERKWKLILCPGPGGRSPPAPDGVTGLPPFQLYDMSQDPAERQNVAGAHPEIVQRLGRLLRTYIERGRTTPGAAQPYVESPWPQIAWKEKF